MSKTKTAITNKAFNNNPSSTGFNLINTPPLAPKQLSEEEKFQSYFDVKTLTQKDSDLIEGLLKESSEDMSSDQIEKDSQILKLLTQEIQAVGRQATYLAGERVYKAKELLKPYRDGTFSKWLAAVFGTRKSGYNKLAYFNLFNEIADDVRDDFKKISPSVGYVLASREGELQVKSEIIKKHHDLPSKDLIEIIQERLPLNTKDKRISSTKDIQKLIRSLQEISQKLEKESESLSTENREDILKVAENLINTCDINRT